MKQSKKWCVLVWFLIVSFSILLFPAADIFAFPPIDNLKKRNVALQVLGFGFAAGLRPNEQGKPNGNGMELIEASWGGSGFIVQEDGTLVTNYHVARLARAAEAVFDDGSKFEIPFIKIYDFDNDIAVLKIKGQKQFPTVNLGDSNTVREMDPVLSVGNTLGLGLNVTDGRISRIVKNDDNANIVLRHTAAIAPGNSGGALYKGDKVVGVNVRGFPQYVLYEAIPINLVKPLLSKQTQNIPLASAFPTNLEAILKKTKQIFARNGQVPAATADKSGMVEIQADFYPLEDLCLILEAQKGQDLAMAVYDDQNKLIGFGNLPGSEIEGILMSNEVNPKKIYIVIINWGKTPVNFGLSSNTIIW